ncbi:MAG: MoaD/ThiS family protein [Deltaproteobacteria bacterium]|nr:MoaD/ThiS family protein [Deltaproteobacteria bacterium]MBW2137514.1 MoaD/ThiS family protein [Deltaproteobacteria bacterium]
MKVTVRLYASLAKYMPKEYVAGDSGVMDAEEGTTLRGLLQGLNIPEGSAKIIFLNGAHARGDEVLKDGDRVGVFPPVAGG